MLIYLMMIETPEDLSKFELLYETYKGLMYHIAFSILHHPEDAEDAVHLSFVKIAENISIIDTSVAAKTKAFIVLITEQRSIDLLRRRERRHTAELEECTGMGMEYHGDNQLACCINSLPAKYRNVIILQYYHGYKPREIAKILGLTQSNIAKLHQRGKKRLEELCRKEGLL